MDKVMASGDPVIGRSVIGKPNYWITDLLESHGA